MRYYAQTQHISVLKTGVVQTSSSITMAVIAAFTVIGTWEIRAKLQCELQLVSILTATAILRSAPQYPSRTSDLNAVHALRHVIHRLFDDRRAASACLSDNRSVA
jgi:hypothetical protein